MGSTWPGTTCTLREARSCHAPGTVCRHRSRNVMSAATHAAPNRWRHAARARGTGQGGRSRRVLHPGETSFPRLHGVASLILRDGDRAQDAVQEALVLAWRQIRARPARPRRVGGLAAPPHGAGLLSAARRRRRRDLVELHVEPDPEPAGAADMANSVAERDRMERELGRLPIDQRAVMVLHFYLDLPLTEAATSSTSPSGPRSPGCTAAWRLCARRWSPTSTHASSWPRSGPDEHQRIPSSGWSLTVWPDDARGVRLGPWPGRRPRR